MAQCTHVMFFPENIVGIEHNSDGPRVARISDYLYEKSRKVCSKFPVFEQLLQPDAIKKLEHMRTVRKFKLKVRPSLFRSTKQIDIDLDNAFQAVRELGEPKEIELMLSVGRGKGTLGEKLRDMAIKLIALRDTNIDVISGEISGYNATEDKVIIIDLLKAKLVAVKRIPRSQNRTSVPQSELVYAAIEESYNELKDQFSKALGVTVCPI